MPKNKNNKNNKEGAEICRKEEALVLTAQLATVVCERGDVTESELESLRNVLQQLTNDAAVRTVPGERERTLGPFTAFVEEASRIGTRYAEQRPGGKRAGGTLRPTPGKRQRTVKNSVAQVRESDPEGNRDGSVSVATPSFEPNGSAANNRDVEEEEEEEEKEEEKEEEEKEEERILDGGRDDNVVPEESGEEEVVFDGGVGAPAPAMDVPLAPAVPLSRPLSRPPKKIRKERVTDDIVNKVFAIHGQQERGRSDFSGPLVDGNLLLSSRWLRLLPKDRLISQLNFHEDLETLSLLQQCTMALSLCRQAKGFEFRSRFIEEICAELNPSRSSYVGSLLQLGDLVGPYKVLAFIETSVPQLLRAKKELQTRLTADPVLKEVFDTASRRIGLIGALDDEEPGPVSPRTPSPFDFLIPTVNGSETDRGPSLPPDVTNGRYCSDPQNGADDEFVDD